MAARPVLENAAARRLFLHRHGLGEPATGPARGDDLCALIQKLGFVQVDSINTVQRAHHMILHARRHSYRPKYLRPLLERDRSLFEHWTHDAAIIPTEFLRTGVCGLNAMLNICVSAGKTAAVGLKIRSIRCCNKSDPAGRSVPPMSAMAKFADRAAGGIGILQRRRSNFFGTPGRCRSPAERRFARFMT